MGEGEFRTFLGCYLEPPPPPTLVVFIIPLVLVLLLLLYQKLYKVSKITADGDCSHEIKRRLLLGRKVMTNLDSILKSRDITLPTKVRLVRLWFFQWSCMDVRVRL